MNVISLREPPELFEQLLLNVPIVEYWEATEGYIFQADGSPALFANNDSVKTWVGFKGTVATHNGGSLPVASINGSAGELTFTRSEMNSTIPALEDLTQGLDVYIVGRFNYSPNTPTSTSTMWSGKRFGALPILRAGSTVNQDPLELGNGSNIVLTNGVDDQDSIFIAQVRPTGDSYLAQINDSQGVDENVTGDTGSSGNLTDDFRIGKGSNSASRFYGAYYAIMITEPLQGLNLFNEYIKPYYVNKFPFL